MVQLAKNPPAMQEFACSNQEQETRVLSLGQEDLLEEEMATHSSIPAWKIPDRGAWWATVHGSQRVGHNLATKPHNYIKYAFRSSTSLTPQISLNHVLKPNLL